MTNSPKHDNYDALMAEAFEFLDIGEPKKALKIGQQLEKMRYSGAFEIQALAYNDLNKRKKAIKTLEKGVKTVPDVWLLWELLGNYYSEESEFEKSFVAFEQGLRTAEPDRVSLNYNYAIALERSGDLQEAKSKVSEIFSDKRFPEDVEAALYFLILALHCSFLNKEAQYEETVSFFEQKKTEISKHETEPSSELSRLFAEIATSYYRLNQTEHANNYLDKAIKADKHNTNAQWLYREMNKNNDFSNAKHFRIMINGRWPEPFEGESDIPWFFTTYEVVADDQTEAFDIIKCFEPVTLHESLKMEEVEIVKKSPNQPKGVYETTGYTFYTENSK
jgi:tetratricopeptide (TPR) repeat protein